MQKFLTISEIAEILKIHAETVRRWIKNGELNAYKLDKSYRVSESDLQDFIDKRKTKGNL